MIYMTDRNSAERLSVDVVVCRIASVVAVRNVVVCRIACVVAVRNVFVCRLVFVVALTIVVRIRHKDCCCSDSAWA